MEVKNWGIGIAVGIIFGIFPAWWYCAAMINNAVAFKGKEVAKLLVVLAYYNPGPGVIYFPMWGKRHYPTVLRIMASVWVIGFIIFFQIYAMRDPVSVNGVLVADLGIIPMLLLTCIIPMYFLNRYLKHAKQRTEWYQNSPWYKE